MSEIVMIKNGSASVENANHIGIDQEKVNLIFRHHLVLRASGIMTAHTSSGAVVEGKEYIQELGQDANDFDNSELAEHGTARQVGHWEEAARKYGVGVRQILLTNQAVDEKTEQGKQVVARVKKTLRPNVLGVINEDPIASTEEMDEYEKSEAASAEGEQNLEPDNDWLAVHVAIAIGATHLLLLTSKDGLEVDKKIKRVVRVDEVEEMLQHCVGSSTVGSGGMYSKLLAMKLAAQNGIYVVTGNAFTDVQRLMEGDEGTRVIQ